MARLFSRLFPRPEVVEHVAQRKGEEVAWADPSRLFPASALTAQYNPDILATRYGLREYDLMRRDDQVKACQAFKKYAVTAAGWEIVSPESREQDWDVRKFVQRNFDEIDGTFDNILIQIMSAMDYGYSVTEKVFSGGTGKVDLIALKTRRPHDIEFSADQFGNLAALKQNTTNGTIELPPEKFVVWSHQKEFGNWYGRSDLEAAHRAWWSKYQTYKWLPMYLEKFGMPPIFILFKKTLADSLTEKLKTVLKNIQNNTTVLFPRGEKDDVEIVTPGQNQNRAGDVYIPAIEMFNQDIARALLMPGLLGVSPDSSVGSHARARVNFDVFMLMIEYLRCEISETVINEQVVRPLVDMNFAVDEYPEFRFLPLMDDDRADLLTTWKDLLSSGAVKSQPDDESHIRKILEFPERDMSEDEQLGEGGELEGAGGPPSPDPEGEPEAPGDTRSHALSLLMTPEERAVDFVQLANDLDGIEARALEAIVSGITRWRDGLIKQIDKDFDPAKPKSVAGIKIQKRGVVANAIGRMLNEAFDTGRNGIRKELPEAFDTASSFEPAEAIAYLLAKKAEIAGILDERLSQEVRTILVAGLKAGLTTREVEQQISAAFLPYVGNPDVLVDGEPLRPHRVEAIVRTNTTDALNQGRLAQGKKAGALLKGWRYSAIIDSRTTDVCKYLHGKTFMADDPSVNKLVPPRHHNCRSLLVPLTAASKIEQDSVMTAESVGRGVELSGLI